MAVTKLIPPRRIVVPKVNRSPPVMPSVPTVARKMPKKQARKPFKTEPPERLATTLNPRTTRAKNSGGPNRSAKFAMTGVAAIITRTLKIPPPIEQMMNSHRA